MRVWTQSRVFEKADLALIHALLAAWGLDLAALAVFLHRHNPMAATSLGAAILTIAAAMALLELRRRRERIAIAPGIVVPLALVHLVFLSTAAWLTWMPGRGFVIDNFALYQ